MIPSPVIGIDYSAINFQFWAISIDYSSISLLFWYNIKYIKLTFLAPPTKIIFRQFISITHLKNNRRLWKALPALLYNLKGQFFDIGCCGLRIVKLWCYSLRVQVSPTVGRTFLATNRFLWRTDRPFASHSRSASQRSIEIANAGWGSSEEAPGGMMRSFLEYVAGLEFGSTHAVCVLLNECLVLSLP